ncbi:MAG: quinone-dependent dihydroorotate dehydrogenase [Candidatus Limnocylindria bacterium]
MTWRTATYRAVRPLLFRADPEGIHHATLTALAAAGASRPGRMLASLASGVSTAGATNRPAELLGLRFRNRIGLAAGFDKDGSAIRGWAALGLGYVELGTVTPRPQPGNPRPRLFRLQADEALVNRMGFNNAGAATLAERIGDARADLPRDFVIGVNIGRNRDTPDERAMNDYREAARAVAHMADYLAINVSSPNTPSLRELQRVDRLRELVETVRAEAGAVPILVKLSPDLDEYAADRLVAMLAEAAVDGVILSNTTTSRADLRSSSPDAEGGLSGRPLHARTVAAVARARELVGDRLVIVASGGITQRPGDLEAVRRAGADLEQLWTGLVYAGPGLIGETVRA